MSKVVFKRGTKTELEQTNLQDGLLSFTVDDGKIHLDYTDENNELKRKTFYSGKLTFGSHVYDGSEDIEVKIYEGEIKEELNNGTDGD